MIALLVIWSYLVVGALITWAMIPRYWTTARAKWNEWEAHKRKYRSDYDSGGVPMEPSDGVWMRSLGTVFFWPFALVGMFLLLLGKGINKAIDYRDPQKAMKARKKAEDKKWESDKKTRELERELDL